MMFRLMTLNIMTFSKASHQSKNTSLSMKTLNAVTINSVILSVVRLNVLVPIQAID
jgi:hypothetical protein